MSITVVPNSGLFNDPTLDSLRGEALRACYDVELPEGLVYYLRALESRYLGEVAERKRRFAAAGWAFKRPVEDEADE